MGSVLEQLAPDLWSMKGDRVRMVGIPFDTRAVVIRLRSGGLWIWSPVGPTPERFEAVAALGEVEHIVGPNKFHHLYLGPWQERFDGAKLWAGPGLLNKREDLDFEGELRDEPEAAWAEEIDQLLFEGSRIFPEAMFLHRASGTLLVTDYLQNHDPQADGWFWRTIKRIDGIVAPKGGVPRDLRLTVRDRDAARRSRDKLLGWEFDRLVMTHGLDIETDAHAFVERAFAWLG